MGGNGRCIVMTDKHFLGDQVIMTIPSYTLFLPVPPLHLALFPTPLLLSAPFSLFISSWWFSQVCWFYMGHLFCSLLPTFVWASSFFSPHLSFLLHCWFPHHPTSPHHLPSHHHPLSHPSPPPPYTLHVPSLPLPALTLFPATVPYFDVTCCVPLPPRRQAIPHTHTHHTLPSSSPGQEVPVEAYLPAHPTEHYSTPHIPPPTALFRLRTSPASCALVSFALCLFLPLFLCRTAALPPLPALPPLFHSTHTGCYCRLNSPYLHHAATTTCPLPTFCTSRIHCHHAHTALCCAASLSPHAVLGIHCASTSLLRSGFGPGFGLVGWLPRAATYRCLLRRALRRFCATARTHHTTPPTHLLCLYYFAGCRTACARAYVARRIFRARRRASRACLRCQHSLARFTLLRAPSLWRARATPRSASCSSLLLFAPPAFYASTISRCRRLLLAFCSRCRGSLRSSRMACVLSFSSPARAPASLWFTGSFVRFLPLCSLTCVHYQNIATRLFKHVFYTRLCLRVLAFCPPMVSRTARTERSFARARLPPLCCCSNTRGAPLTPRARHAARARALVLLHTHARMARTL